MQTQSAYYPRLAWIYEHFGLVICYAHVTGIYLCTLPKGHAGPHEHDLDK